MKRLQALARLDILFSRFALDRAAAVFRVSADKGIRAENRAGERVSVAWTRTRRVNEPLPILSAAVPRREKDPRGKCDGFSHDSWRGFIFP